MILTDYYLRRKINSLAKNAPKRDHRYCTIEQAGDILISYSIEDKEVVHRYMEKLRVLGKNVSGCIYIPKNKIHKPDSTCLQVKEGNDTNLLMLPRAELMIKFTELPADILIDLSRPTDHIIHYMVLYHPAKLKVGRKMEGVSLYDISLIENEEDTVEKLSEDILFYLQTIRSK
ncbi:MAG: hypothetical protein LIP01_13890 [Tannerellaceae bacterium]|nr:hypothetical protein [Tannerellaceae bacterium]